MYQINYRLFNELVEENTELLKDALYNDIPLTDLLSRLKTIDWLITGRRLHNNVIMRKSFDILPSAYMGLLSYTQANGTDAIKVELDGSITEYELKTSELNSDLVWQTKKGTLHRGGANTRDKKRSLKAQFSASYNLHTPELIKSKNMKTVLFTADSAGRDGYFDAWEMSGNAVIDRLTTDQQGRALTEHRQKRELSLNTFMNKGNRAKTVVDLMGYNNWANEVRKKAPVLKPGEIFLG